MTVRMRRLLDDPQSAVNMLVGRGAIEAALTAWTVGDYIHGNGRGGPGFLKDLSPPPPEIWEFKITHPAPAARVFGRFAEPDTFVATDMHTRNFLRKKGSQAWLQTCSQVAADWATLFPDNAPFSGQNARVSDYVTEDCDEFPLQQ